VVEFTARKSQSTGRSHITSKIRTLSKITLTTRIPIKFITTMEAEAEVAPPGSVPQQKFVFVRIFQHFRSSTTGSGGGFRTGLFFTVLMKL
jgi:hypothetical protein